MSSPTTPDLAARFILDQLARHRETPNSERALVVGIQGPQGSGKSYLASTLASSPLLSHLGVASLSLDDLYLPHSALSALAAAHPRNRLLHGRGQAGTHDLALGVDVLDQLTRASVTTDRVVRVPVFEKHLFDGEGDRVDEQHWVEVDGRVDVVLFEGWMLGFRPVEPPAALSAIYALAETDPRRAARDLGLDYDEPFLLQHRREDLEQVNRELAQYDDLWKRVDAFVQLRPAKMGYVWEWRLEQEHNMKAKNGGVGMTDEQVKTFISRYMPGYELFLKGIDSPDVANPWTGNGLKILIDKRREVQGVERF
ncbi:hypothetical protein JCM10212_004724 [Sporobolomyces blumeae]